MIGFFLAVTMHTSMPVAQACLGKILHYQFWSIAYRYLDLVSRPHVQVRLRELRT